MAHYDLNIEGNKYGLLTVLWRSAQGFRTFVCVCSCGELRNVSIYSLFRGTKACGCTRIAANKMRTTHGLANHPLKSTYFNMLRRCGNVDDLHYKDYGGRGIIVEDRWSNPINGMINFFSDMGVKPSNCHTLDRIDNNGNYCKENCRWATHAEQHRNKRNNVLYLFNGDVYTQQEMQRKLNLSVGTLYYARKHGKPLPEGVTLKSEQ